jgi:hypothetical protein
MTDCRSENHIIDKLTNIYTAKFYVFLIHVKCLKRSININIPYKVYVIEVTIPDNNMPEFVNLLRWPGINSQLGGPVRQPYLTVSASRDRIRKRLRSPGINSKESDPPD